MAFRRSRDYPRCIYGPYGASMTINGPDEWIEGWTDAPEGSAVPPQASVGPITLNRIEIKARLRAAGVEFDDKAARSALWQLLLRSGA